MAGRPNLFIIGAMKSGTTSLHNYLDMHPEIAMSEEKEVSEEVMRLLRARHEIRVNQLPDSLDPARHDVSAAGTTLTRNLIATERKFIHNLLRDGQITDETRRRIERDLDLEEASLANREYRGTPL